VQPPEVIRLSLVERGRAGQAVCRALFVRLETLRSHCGTYHTIATGLSQVRAYEAEQPAEQPAGQRRRLLVGSKRVPRERARGVGH